MKITNVKSNYDNHRDIVTSISGKVRIQLIKYDVTNKTWSEKKKIIKDKLIDTYGNIPMGISFTQRKTKDIENNPDGLRIFVLCKWIKRNRFSDYKGIFHMGSLINAINKKIDYKTKRSILCI